MTTEVTVLAYYSGRYGNPDVAFRRGMVGTFYGTAPAVGSNKTLYIVDFFADVPRAGTGDGLYQWRVALYKEQIRKIK